MREPRPQITAAELERLPDDDHRYELVEGRLLRMSPVGFEHGYIVARLMGLLLRHVQPRSLGFIGTEVGFKLRSNPDTVRAPDVAFIRADRLPATRLKGFWTGAPDLAIEVISADDHPADIEAKVEEYLLHGVRMVVIVRPDESTVTIHRPYQLSKTYRGAEPLDLDDVIPGFRCTTSEVYE